MSAREDIPFREGDIVRWSYRDWDYSKSRFPYHCKSCIAVVQPSLRFCDTYWGSVGEGFCFGVDDFDFIEVTRIANFDEIEKSHSSDAEYYDDADIVDLNHSNSASGNFYLRKGAKRSQAKMLASAQYRLERAEERERSAKNDADRAREAMARIVVGDLEGWL